jgi:hypothetical protein
MPILRQFCHVSAPDPAQPEPLKLAPIGEKIIAGLYAYFSSGARFCTISSMMPHFLEASAVMK